MSTPYTNNLSKEQMYCLAMLLSDSYLPVEVSKPSYKAFYRDQQFSDTTRILLKEFISRFIDVERTSERASVFDSPLLKAWTDCCLLIGALRPTGNNFGENVLNSVQKLTDLVRQYTDTTRGTLLEGLYPQINLENSRQKAEQIISHLALIDSWDRNIISLHDDYYSVKMENPEYVYGAYRWCFSFIYERNHVANFEYTEADKSLANAFMEKLVELYGHDETQSLYQEYKMKREHTDKRRKKAKVTF